MEKERPKYMVQITEPHDALVKMCVSTGYHIHLLSRKEGHADSKLFRECTETELLQAIMLDTL